MQDWLGLMRQASSRRWRSHRRSVCLISPMCRPWRKRCQALSPSAGSAWWRRSERRKRSCARSAMTCARCWSNPSRRWSRWPCSSSRSNAGWVDVLNSALYPLGDATHRPSPPGCPAFGNDSVLDRGPEGIPPAEGSIQPGLHRPSAGGPPVTWWDPAVLQLDVEEQAPLRQQPGAPQQDGRLATQPAIIAPRAARCMMGCSPLEHARLQSGNEAAASEASYANWKTAREEILASAPHPSLSVQTAILATAIRLMAMATTTGRAIAPPAGWRSIAPAGTWGISPRASHRSGLDTLASSGSLRDLVSRHLQDRAGQIAVGAPELIQNCEMVRVCDRDQVAGEMLLRAVSMVVPAARDHRRQLARTIRNGERLVDAGPAHGRKSFDFDLGQLELVVDLGG